MTSLSRSLQSVFGRKSSKSSFRFSVCQDRYDRRSGEAVQSHFLKYAALAANLQPPLSERLHFSQSSTSSIRILLSRTIFRTPGLILSPYLHGFVIVSFLPKIRTHFFLAVTILIKARLTLCCIFSEIVLTRNHS